MPQRGIHNNRVLVSSRFFGTPGEISPREKPGQVFVTASVKMRASWKISNEIPSFLIEMIDPSWKKEKIVGARPSVV